MIIRFNKTIKSIHEQRLDKWFLRNYPNTPYVFIQKLIRKGLIKVNNKISSASLLIRSNDKITSVHDFDKEVTLESCSQNLIRDNEIEKMILHEDSDLCVINKPPGIPSQGGTKIKKSIDSMFNNCGLGKYFIVHRLDKDTSGVMLLAKNYELCRKLIDEFAKNKIIKSYIAIIEGIPKITSGTIDLPIGKAHFRNEELMFVDFKNGKPSRTKYRILASDEEKRISLIQCFPQTGRKHQIRVHFSHINCPVLGDKKYGTPLKNNRMYLHSAFIQINDLNGVNKNFSAQIPQYFYQKSNKWKKINLDMNF